MEAEINGEKDETKQRKTLTLSLTNTHTTTATHCPLSTQQKIKAYHYTFISSFFPIPCSLYLSTWNPLFPFSFLFLCQPSLIFTSLLCIHTHSAAYRSLIQLASAVCFQPKQPSRASGGCKKIWFTMNFPPHLSVLSCRNKCMIG